MTLTLELPQDLEKALLAEATQLSLPLPEYMLRVLYLRPAIDSKPKTGADLVAYWQETNLIGNRQDIKDSQKYARELRAEAEKRNQS
jgi:hypothetical protein